MCLYICWLIFVSSSPFPQILPWSQIQESVAGVLNAEAVSVKQTVEAWVDTKMPSAWVTHRFYSLPSWGSAGLFVSTPLTRWSSCFLPPLCAQICCFSCADPKRSENTPFVSVKSPFHIFISYDFFSPTSIWPAIISILEFMCPLVFTSSQLPCLSVPISSEDGNAACVISQTICGSILLTGPFCVAVKILMVHLFLRLIEIYVWGV